MNINIPPRKVDWMLSCDPVSERLSSILAKRFPAMENKWF